MAIVIKISFLCSYLFIFMILLETKAETDCGGDIQADLGTIIRSPGYPNSYPDNIKCTWRLFVTPPNRVLLKIKYFLLESEETCKFDNLIIRDGENGNSVLIGKFCSDKIKDEIVSLGNVLTLEFTTDRSNVFKGFEIFVSSKGPVLPTTVLPYVITKVTGIPGVNLHKNKLLNWMLSKRNFESAIEKWNLQTCRVTTALYLEDSKYFSMDNKTGDELRYEITIQLLSKLAHKNELNSQELASNIHAMLVSCLNPRKFQGYNLISKLREAVERKDRTNPYALLVLCNAGDTMTTTDVQKIKYAYMDSQQKPFWIGNQAIALMALTCILNKNNIQTNETTALQITMIQEIKDQQTFNGSIGSLQETALALQALIATDSLEEGFDLQAAVESILGQQDEDGSFGSLLTSYYLLPVLNHKSLVDINTDHCTSYKSKENEDLNAYLDSNKKKIKTKLNFQIENNINFSKSWTLNIIENRTFYDVLEMVYSMDCTFSVKYIVNGTKPFIMSISTMENDPELGYIWLTYVKNSSSLQETLLEQSPVDIRVLENQQYFLRYKLL